MKLLGFWREYTKVGSDPSVYEDINLNSSVNINIVSYLNLNTDKEGLMGGAVKVSRGTAHECLIIPDNFYSYGFLTDGEYIWTNVFVEYYNMNYLNLPKDFLDRMESFNYIVPEISDKQYQQFQSTIQTHFYPNRWDNP